jgi:hypothetical protein
MNARHSGLDGFTTVNTNLIDNVPSGRTTTVLLPNVVKLAPPIIEATAIVEVRYSFKFWPRSIVETFTFGLARSTLGELTWQSVEK